MEKAFATTEARVVAAYKVLSPYLSADHNSCKGNERVHLLGSTKRCGFNGSLHVFKVSSGTDVDGC